MATVDLELNADLRKATRDLSKFSKDAGGAIDGLKASFSTLGKIAAAAASAFAVKKIVDAANQQEQAVKSLNTALALTGEFSEKTSKQFQAFASELQKNSTVGDEVSLSMVALTKSMGATNEQTQKIIQAAADMSAVTGQTLESSVRNLSKTLGGLKGELGETQPELRNLTVQQLKAGEAVDILAQKYRGSAKELTKTFAGAAKQAQNSFGDLLEEVGFLITTNPLFIKSVNLLSEAFVDLGNFVKENRRSLINFSIDAVVGTIKGISFLIERIGDTVAVFKNMDAVIDLVYLSLADLGVSGLEVSDSLIKGFKGIVNFALKPVLSGVEGVAKGMNALGVISDKTLGGFKSSLDDLALNSSTSGLESLTMDVKAFRDAARDGFVESADRLKETKDGFQKAADSVSMFADSMQDLKKESSDANESLKKLSKTNAEIIKNTGTPFQDRTFFGGSVTGADVLSGAGQAVTAISKGGAGATDLLASGASAAANAFLPGAGAIAGPVAQILAAGPEAAKGMVNAFVDQIPVLIENIADALPVVVEALVERAPDIIVALVKGAPQIARAMAIEVPIALAKSLPGALEEIFQQFLGGVGEGFGQLFGGLDLNFQDLVAKIGEGFSNLFGDLPQKIGELIQDAVKKLGDAFRKIYIELPQRFLQALVDGLRGAGQFLLSVFSKLGETIVKPIKDFFGSLNLGKLLGGGGGGGVVGKVTGAIGGAVKSVSKAFGFAEGGTVPAGFPNDTFPARLSSGENIIDRSTNEKLNRFLDTGGGPTRVVLQVGEKQLAEVLLNLNRQGFRTA